MFNILEQFSSITMDPAKLNGNHSTFINDYKREKFFSVSGISLPQIYNLSNFTSLFKLIFP